MAFDPEEDDGTTAPKPLRQDTPQGQSADASQKGKLRQMWDDWTSRPENNAAMVNFGLQLMQPVAAGQSRLGHFGEAIGAGLEAGGRVATKEEERQRADEAQELKEAEQARRERETDYYGASVGAKTGADPRALARLKMGQYFRDQSQRKKGFEEWLTDRGGQYIASDPMFKEIQRAFPKIVSKADLQNPANADALRYAQQLHAKSFTPERSLEEELVAAGVAPGGGGGLVGGAPQAGRSAIPPGARPVYQGDTITGYYVNGRYFPTTGE